MRLGPGIANQLGDTSGTLQAMQVRQQFASGSNSRNTTPFRRASWHRPAGRYFDGPDDVSVTPWGTLVLAEDGVRASHVLSAVPGGPTFAIARGQLSNGTANGAPHVAPVGWSYNSELDFIDIGGRAFEKSKKYRDVRRSGRAA